MNLPDTKFLKDNNRNFKQSLAVKNSNKTSAGSKDLKRKIRKQIILTHSCNDKLEILSNHYKISNSAVIEFCVNEFYRTLTTLDKNVPAVAVSKPVPDTPMEFLGNLFTEIFKNVQA